MELKIQSKIYGEQIVLIDDEDYDKIKCYNWHLIKRRKDGGIYIQAHSKNKTIHFHRLIMNCPKGLYVDHINHDTLDNRKCNLRICTNSENNINKFKIKKFTTSIYKGVTKTEYNTYKAEIRFNGTHLRLGSFKTEDQAAIAYNIACLKYHGEFCRPNLNIMMQKGN